MHFLLEYTEMFYIISVFYQGYIMVTYLNTSDINFGWLVKIMSSGFPYCKATSFSFVINNQIGGDTLGLCKYLTSL